MKKDLPMFYLPVLATPDSICQRCSCSLENPHVRGPTWSLLIPHPVPPVLGRYPLAKPTHGLQLALKLTKNGGMSEGMIGYPWAENSRPSHNMMITLVYQLLAAAAALFLGCLTLMLGILRAYHSGRYPITCSTDDLPFPDRVSKAGKVWRNCGYAFEYSPLLVWG